MRPTPKPAKQATIADLARTVNHADELHMDVSEKAQADLALLLEVALKKIGFAAIGGSIDIDLGNGHSLHCTVVAHAFRDKTQAAIAARTAL